MQIVCDPVTAPQEHLRALSARIRVMVSEAIHQGATTALVATQLVFGTVVKVMTRFGLWDDHM